MTDQEKINNSRLAFILSFMTVAGFALWRLLLVTLLPLQSCVALTEDDAYYYMNIALNIVKGNGVTFDGINLTNGFHPLWQIMLVPVYWLIPDDKDLALRVILVLQLVIYLTGVVLVSRFIHRRYGYLAVLPGLAVFFISLYSNKFVEGMETPVQLVILILIVIYMATKWCDNEVTNRKDIVLGLLIGLMGLARLETVIIIVPCCFYVLWHNIRNRKGFISLIGRGCRIGVPAIGVVSPFLIWNKFNFGSFATISSRLKSSFPHLSFDPGIILKFPQWAVFVAACLLFVALMAFRNRMSFFRRISDKMTSGYGAAVLIYACFVIMHFSLILFFSRWEIAGWYFGFYMLILPLSAGPVLMAVQELFDVNRSKPLFVSIYSILVVLMLLLAVATQIMSAHYRISSGVHEIHRHSYLAGMWAKENTPEAAVFATTDCGVFGYFSERSVVELDGVVNNYSYQEWLLEKGLRSYLEGKGVDYVRHYSVVLPQDYTNYCYSIKSILDPAFIDGVVLRRENEVYRSPAFQYANSQRQQVIWKFKENDGEQ